MAEIAVTLLVGALEFVSAVGQTIIQTLIGLICSCLPIGVLPRKSIKGDTALITGSGSGIGRLMAVEFAKHGCDIVLWDVNEKGNAETKAMIEKETSSRVFAYTVDLSDRLAIAACADKVKKQVGNIDILINNAGIVTGKKIFDCPDELMEKTMAVNCMACLYATKHFAKSMIERNHGHIVTVASIAGKLGTAGLVDYCASKHGAVGFHSSITEELRHLKADGVKTTLICPYYINTGMFDGVVTNAPNVLPILDPAYVIECIMEAVLTEKEQYFIPRFLYITVAFFALFPSKANALMMDYFKIADTMTDFKGRDGKPAGKAH